MSANDTTAEPLALQDEDRLPWLEAVDDEDAGAGVDTGKLMGFLVAALVALGLFVGGVWLMRSRDARLKGDGKLIAAQEGAYKVKPAAPGGMKVEGQGDTAFTTSEGAEANGKIDLNATPETPVAAAKTSAGKATVQPAAKPVATAAIPASGGKLVAPPPAKPTNSGAASGTGGALVQLGSFNSEAKANEGWVSLTKRFAYLAPLGKSIATATVNGKTVYRLRANAAGEASTICGKLKVAGENCLVVD